MIRKIPRENRRTRKEGHNTQDKYVRMYIRWKYNDTCVYCKRIYKPKLARKYPSKYFSRMEIDHIVPFSKNGLNHVKNYALSCRMCNRKKGDKY